MPKLTFLTVLLSMLLALPVAAQEGAVSGYRAEILKEINTSADRFIRLAEAIPVDQFAWRPAEGVRSIGEVLVHIGNANYGLPARIGVPVPEGLNLRDAEQTITEKEAILAHLRTSFDHLRGAITAISDSRMDEQVAWFGDSQNSVRGVLLVIVKHMAEHQGQLIAYARTNQITPPWSE